MINFINPYIEIYCRPNELELKFTIPFYREILWMFLKNLDNRLKMFQHRVNIVFVDSDSLTGIQRFASIYEYSLKIDTQEFQKQDDLTKRKMLLDIVYNAFIALANDNNWDKEIITDAYNKSLDDTYIFFYQTDFKSDRSKKNRGRICISLKNNIATLTANITNNESNETYETELLSANEDILSWYRKIKNFGWLDKSRFGLKLLEGELWIVTNTESKQQEIVINPKKRNKEYIDLYLKELQELPPKKQ